MKCSEVSDVIINISITSSAMLEEKHIAMKTLFISLRKPLRNSLLSDLSFGQFCCKSGNLSDFELHTRSSSFNNNKLSDVCPCRLLLYCYEILDCVKKA